MKFITLMLSVAISLTSVAVTPRMVCSPAEKPSQPRHHMKVVVEKVDNNNSDGVSRVSCTLMSIPHTSSRVDSVTALIDRHVYKATDIDGVDFERYFQWEDDGAVPVEVDLKRTLKFNEGDSIIFHTVHGVFSAPLKI
ncbi:MAG: hypothetical protein NC082_06280 [Clostridiales bacterium]|nr:hypothetical protein [Clostridiales bacterium]